MIETGSRRKHGAAAILRLLRASLAMLLLGATGLSGCAVQTVATRASETDRDGIVIAAIGHLARHGDGLVIRGVHDTDNFIATVTNKPFSHAGLLDRQRLQVIEAEGIGVHSSSIADFVAKSQRLLVIHPMWSNDSSADAAVNRARELIGNKYDYLGLLGINVKQRYYCTELAVSVYQPPTSTSNPMPPVIEPGQLYHWGTIVYDSGPGP